MESLNEKTESYVDVVGQDVSSGQVNQKPVGKKCKKCGEGLFKRSIIMFIIEIYLLFSSIYGTIQLFKNLF